MLFQRDDERFHATLAEVEGRHGSARVEDQGDGVLLQQRGVRPHRAYVGERDGVHSVEAAVNEAASRRVCRLLRRRWRRVGQPGDENDVALAD